MACLMIRWCEAAGYDVGYQFLTVGGQMRGVTLLARRVPNGFHVACRIPVGFLRRICTMAVGFDRIQVDGVVPSPEARHFLCGALMPGVWQ
jgi:hypothetical protein